MSLNPVKIANGSAGITPTPGADAKAVTGNPTQTSGAATFFKDIGQKMAAVYKAIGDGISNLVPKHKPTSESLSPGSKAAFANFRDLQKQADKLEKLDNPTPTQQARLQEVKDELKAARKEVTQHLKTQFYNGPLYAAAQAETNSSILNSKDFLSTDPAETVSDALGYVLQSSSRLEKVMMSGMKIDEAVSIYLYTQGAYSGINKELRGGTPSEFIQKLTENVTSGLARLPPFEEPVYRIVSLPPFVDKQYQEGATVSDRGLLSTTFNVDFDLFGGGTSHVLSIVGRGDSAGRDVSWLSETPSEKEVLFPPGTEFVVKQRDLDTMPNVIGKMSNGDDKYDSQVGILLVQKPK